MEKYGQIKDPLDTETTLWFQYLRRPATYSKTAVEEYNRKVKEEEIEQTPRYGRKGNERKKKKI